MFFKKAYYTKAEIAHWLSSVAMIFASFFLFGGDSLLSLVASLIGVSSLLLIAKGNPIGQLLSIIFSVFYGIISYSFAYYGEMLTYLCMTAPMALLALITWLKHPFEGNKSEVEIAKLTKKDLPPMLLLTAAVTEIFYFYIRSTEHRQSGSEHRFGHHQLSCGVPHLQAQSVLCVSVCGKRPCVDRSLDACVA